MNQEIHVSHSRIKELGCPRAYQHAYPMNLELDRPKAALVLGNAFHKGMEAALDYSVYADKDYEDRGYVILATAAGHDYIDTQAAQFQDPNDGSPAEMKAIISAMFRAYIPEIGINRKWRVALHHEVFPTQNCDECMSIGEYELVCSYCDGKGCVEEYDKEDIPIEVECPDCYGSGENMETCKCCGGTGYDEHNITPVVELHFNEHIKDGIYAKGIIDAVLYDIENAEYVAIDWKTMTNPRTIEDLALDSQVHVYVAVLQHMGSTVDTLAMWEFAKTLPQSYKITPKKGEIAKGAQKSTWDVWYGSLSPDHKIQVDANYDAWKEWAEIKLHPMTDFSNYLEDYVTPKAAKNALDNLVAQGQYIRLMEATGVYPAIQNSGYGGKCKGCQFRILCAGVYRYGGDPQTVIENSYRQKTRS